MSSKNKSVPVPVMQDRTVFTCDVCGAEEIGTDQYGTTPKGWYRLLKKEHDKLIGIDLCKTACLETLVRSLVLDLDLDLSVLRINKEKA